jgi:hypothetical protein
MTGHRSIVGLLVLGVVAAASGLAGAAIERYVILRRLGPLTALTIDSGSGRAHKYTARMADEFDLSPEQQKRIDSIITFRLAELRVVRNQVRSQLIGMIDTAQTEIAGVMTPAQREKFLEERRRKGFTDSAGHQIIVPAP